MRLPFVDLADPFSPPSPGLFMAFCRFFSAFHAHPVINRKIMRLLSGSKEIMLHEAFPKSFPCGIGESSLSLRQGEKDYPSATSKIIMMRKPSITPAVPE